MISIAIQNLVKLTVRRSCRYLLLFTLDRAEAYGRQSEHHAGVLAEGI